MICDLPSAMRGERQAMTSWGEDEDDEERATRTGVHLTSWTSLRRHLTSWGLVCSVLGFGFGLLCIGVWFAFALYCYHWGLVCSASDVTVGLISV